MDVVLALVAALKADAGVATLVGSNVFDFDVPKPQDDSMSIKCIVVRPHGGPATFKQTYLNDSRVDLMCYGETKHLAYVVNIAVYQALKNLQSSVWANTYLFWANEQTGPIPGIDTVLQWPYVTSSWIVRASDLTIA